MENIDEDIKIVEDYLLGKKMQYGEKYYKNNNNFQAIENLLSRLKTAERMNDVLAEQLGKTYTNCKFCKNFTGNSYMFACKEYSNKNQCIKEWARKRVEDDSSCSNER